MTEPARHGPRPELDFLDTPPDPSCRFRTTPHLL